MFYQASIHLFSQNCLHILSKVFRRTAKQQTQKEEWIKCVNNSMKLLEHLKSPNFNHIKSIKPFNFSNLYTTIPHEKLKSKLASIIRNSFIFKTVTKDSNIWYEVTKKHVFLKEHFDPKSKYSEEDIIKILEFLVDSIFMGLYFAEKVFQQIVGIPMGQIASLF